MNYLRSLTDYLKELKMLKDVPTPKMKTSVPLEKNKMDQHVLKSVSAYKRFDQLPINETEEEGSSSIEVSDAQLDMSIHSEKDNSNLKTTQDVVHNIINTEFIYFKTSNKFKTFRKTQCNSDNDLNLQFRTNSLPNVVSRKQTGNTIKSYIPENVLPFEKAEYFTKSLNTATSIYTNTRRNRTSKYETEYKLNLKKTTSRR